MKTLHAVAIALALTAPALCASAAEFTVNGKDRKADKADIAKDKQDLKADKKDIAKDKADLAKDRKDKAADKADVARDRKDITADKKDVAADRKGLSEERKDLHHDLAQLKADRKAGDKAAVKADKIDIKADRKNQAETRADLHKDRKDLSRDAADKRRDLRDTAKDKKFRQVERLAFEGFLARVIACQFEECHRHEAGSITLLGTVRRRVWPRTIPCAEMQCPRTTTSDRTQGDQPRRCRALFSRTEPCPVHHRPVLAFEH